MGGRGMRGEEEAECAELRSGNHRLSAAGGVRGWKLSV